MCPFGLFRHPHVCPLCRRQDRSDALYVSTLGCAHPRAATPALRVYWIIVVPMVRLCKASLPFLPELYRGVFRLWFREVGIV